MFESITNALGRVVTDAVCPEVVECPPCLTLSEKLSAQMGETMEMFDDFAGENAAYLYLGIGLLSVVAVAVVGLNKYYSNASRQAENNIYPIFKSGFNNDAPQGNRSTYQTSITDYFSSESNGESVNLITSYFSKR